MSIHVFGIRHHGPGCARALRSALEALKPDVVLVEGPPDADEHLPLMLDDAMRPPVALLVYRPDEPRQAVFYPFTTFSPEWQALRFALERGVPARFIDLPQTHQFARKPPRAPEAAKDESAAEPRDEVEASSDRAVREDPLGVLALAAGYDDRELWWEHQVEQRRDAVGLFDGIMNAMQTLRAEHKAHPDDEDEPLREAHMRQCIRAAVKEGFERIAVVCGAWHAPVLAEPGPAKADAALLRGLPKTKVAATWIPWTHNRLSYRSGYGAGVASPGWYEHLWQAPDRSAVRWAVSAAHLLRSEDLDASSAEVIDTVRLAETLAAIRGLPMPGLSELNESVRTVLCRGHEAPMALIRDRLEIGDRLGEVPESTPTVPLQRDLEAQQRSLRLPPSTAIKMLDLDLREATDLARSRLLHQLSLLEIEWGALQPVRGKAGTFHEVWQLQWHPEFAVRIIEASLLGRTVADAATHAVREAANAASDLAGLTTLLDRAVLANLPNAVQFLLAQVQARAAVSTDVQHLMIALPALARVARYGDVRKTETADVLPIIGGLFERIVVGLGGACGSLDDEAASQMTQAMSGVEESLALLDAKAWRAEWHEVLPGICLSDGVHGLVRGFCCRLLLEAGALTDDDLHRLTRLALSTATPPPQAAAWIEGLLRGSGMLLLHRDAIWVVLDRWLCELDAEAFVAVLPLLRRAFSGFTAPERRMMGEKVKTMGRSGEGIAAKPQASETPDIDVERANRVLPVLARLLGVTE